MSGNHYGQLDTAKEEIRILHLLPRSYLLPAHDGDNSIEERYQSPVHLALALSYVHLVLDQLYMLL